MKIKCEVDHRTIYFHSKVIMKGTPKQCFVCGYDKFVDICHIVAVRTFEKTAKVSDINSRSNLVYLCPNHHHELDGGLLKLPSGEITEAA